jgi:hypothetical protein
MRWRIVIPAVLGALALAGGFAYFVTPPAPVEAEKPSVSAAPDVTSSMAVTPAIVGQRRTAEDFERAAKEILKRLPNAQASVPTNEPPIVGHVPLPKRRPIAAGGSGPLIRF